MREDFDLLVMIEYSSVKLFSLAVGIFLWQIEAMVSIPILILIETPWGSVNRINHSFHAPRAGLPTSTSRPSFKGNGLVRSRCRGHLAALRRACFPPDGRCLRWRDLPGTPVSNGAPDTAGSRYSVKRHWMISGCGKRSAPFLARSHLVVPCHRTR